MVPDTKVESLMWVSTIELAIADCAKQRAAAEKRAARADDAAGYDSEADDVRMTASLLDDGHEDDEFGADDDVDASDDPANARARHDSALSTRLAAAEARAARAEARAVAAERAAAKSKSNASAAVAAAAHTHAVPALPPTSAPRDEQLKALECHEHDALQVRRTSACAEHVVNSKTS